MKKTIIEELERIHSITYGKNVILEKNILDKLLGKKIDDPKKADFVSDDVKQFYKTLEDSASEGGLSQQKKGGMSFQKAVESMQIGLILLGYKLPKFGVDGFFGPETANAVRKFKSEQMSDLKEDASALRSTLTNLGYDEKGGEISSGGNITTQISSVTSNILSDFKKIKPNVDVVITAGNDNFHKKLGYKSKHTEGQAIDLVLKPYNKENANSFISILNKYKSKDSKFSYIDEYTNPSGAATGGHFHLQYGEGVAKGSGLETADSDMLNKLLELLKAKGVTSEDLVQHIDKTADIDFSEVTDVNFYSKLLENLGAKPTKENLKFMYAWRQAEGKSGKYNPFNTTWNLPGSTNFNSVGVKNYKSLEDGMIATVKTLRNPRYGCIVDGLRNNIGAEQIARCESLKTWGTGDLVAKVIDGYNSGSSPKIKSLA